MEKDRERNRKIKNKKEQSKRNIKSELLKERVFNKLKKTMNGSANSKLFLLNTVKMKESCTYPIATQL